MKTVAIIQARMGSTRLPGKVMLPILNKPTLQWMVERVSKSKLIDEIVIATTGTSREILNWAFTSGVKFYIGPENDVMRRVLWCADFCKTDVIIDLTSDCPFVDPRHIDELIQLKHISNSQYASNIYPRSFPDGFDIQVYNTNLLKLIDPIIKQQYRQHTGWNIINLFPELCKTNLRAKGIYNWPGLRLTLDTKEDFETIKNIIEYKIGPKWIDLSAEQIIDIVIDNPELIKNRNVATKPPGE